MTHRTHPPKQGLYDPRHEHDSCGVGFVVNLKSRKSHAIVEQALQILVNLEHRGACGCEKDTGDGAGILVQTPHDFLAKVCERAGFRLPKPGDYAVGCVFLPTEAADRRRVEGIFEEMVRDEGQTVLGWRTVPVNPGPLGLTAREAMPIIRQNLHRPRRGARPPRRPRFRAEAVRHPPPR